MEVNFSEITSRPTTPNEVNTFGSAQDEEASLSSSSSLDSASPGESQASFPESSYPMIGMLLVANAITVFRWDQLYIY